MMHKLLLIPILLLLGITFSATSFCTEPTQTTLRPTTPTEIYGPEEADIALTLGNGGAGPTCVLQALSEDFIVSQNRPVRIGWIQSISRLTLENLKEHVIDISLTYESEPELQAISEGWASDRTLVFNDHFIIVGPKNNPAGILPSDTPEEAFTKIAAKGKLFSRDDLSGSNQRERAIWENISLSPWEKPEEWYVTETIFPADALKRADREGLYTVTDRGTLLAVHHELSNTAVYVQDGNTMMNRCHAMLQANASPLAKEFLNYLQSPRAQSLIATYAGKDKNCILCCPLFTPAKADKFLDAKCIENLGFTPSSS